MRRRWILVPTGVLAGVTAVVAAIGAGACWALTSSPKARPTVVSLAEGFDPLKQAFSESDGKPRYLAILSPT